MTRFDLAVAIKLAHVFEFSTGFYCSIHVRKPVVSVGTVESVYVPRFRVEPLFSLFQNIV